MPASSSVRLWCALLLVGSLATGAEPGEEPVLEVSAPPGTVSVGDRVPVRVAARGGDGWLWGEVAVEVGELGPWEVVEGPRAIAGARPPAWELVLAPMAVGDQPLPDLRATVRSPDGEARQVGPAGVPTVNVASVLPPDQEVEPAPLRDPVGVHGVPWEWLVPAAVALAPLLLAAAWWWRRTRRSAAGGRALRLPPFEALQALLDELGARVGREPAAGVCDRLAGGVRRYLEERSGAPALEMTSFELRVLARSSGWPEPAQRSLREVTGVVDSVRFARRPVVDGDLRRAIEAAGEAGRVVETFLSEREGSGEVGR